MSGDQQDEAARGGGSGGGGGGSESSGEFGPPEVLGASGGFGAADPAGGADGPGGPGGFGAPSAPGGPGGFGGYGAPPPPPMPTVPPTPPMPPTPPAPADPLRAAAVALLNLSGLGLGYLLLRRWLALAVCWVATGVLLAIALPADPDGVPAGAVVAYLAVLVLAAAHGAYRGLRHSVIWPPRSPVAIVLGLVLLAAPVSGVVLYDGARDEATQQMLLDRLADADQLVTQAKGQQFTLARASYSKALTTYHDLDAHHPGSRAARRVPTSLNTYYETVATPFGEKKYCDAVEPLTYLRTVPGTYGRKQLGALAGWPDDKLATSLYECGVTGLGTGKDVVSPSGNLGELLTTFPSSKQAAKVEPAVSSEIDKAAGDLKGSQPCAANERLKILQGQAVGLPGKEAGVDSALTDALREDAATAGKKVQSGTYACGVDEYKKGDFSGAQKTLSDFVSTYRSDKNHARAQKIAIAAEIAQSEAAAGKHLPSMASGGSIPVTISNDSPDEVEILYTGPVTGSFKLKACKGCSAYSSDVTAQTSACKGGKSYPKRTISLPPGTSYFLHKSLNTSNTTSGSNTARIRPGYTYTECAYVVQGIGSGYTS
ncbi:hypothetical protein [Streptomyces sp. NBC_00932]|uniref:hypothetical protein n=1 Tax=Streptomyces sp. NBC_00932 TaxID=2903690 RepID=UPI0038646A71|nr:hypothetical protein OG221_21190 [Streptomyces sp. NBC_00932]